MPETAPRLAGVLKNPVPKYTLERGTKCYVAMDNAHGGFTVPAAITALTTFPDSRNTAYEVRYRDQLPPYASHDATAAPDEIFPDLAAVAKARQDDLSLQARNMTDICSTPEGLVRFLLDHTVLPDRDLDTVAEAAKALGLYGKD